MHYGELENRELSFLLIGLHLFILNVLDIFIYFILSLKCTKSNSYISFISINCNDMSQKDEILH